MSYRENHLDFRLMKLTKVLVVVDFSWKISEVTIRGHYYAMEVAVVVEEEQSLLANVVGHSLVSSYPSMPDCHSF